MPVMAKNVVATSQPLAAQTGLRMLLDGGNAVDAAIAAAITLTVVEPTSNGIGSDAFAVVSYGKELFGLNGSGKSPAGWTADYFAGKESMPEYGWDSVTVPGAVSAWVELSERFGKLSFEQLFVPAIEYARNGFPVSPITAAAWKKAEQTYREFKEFGAAFLPGGRAPKAGEKFAFPDQAKTLELIASSRGKAFYTGEIAELIASTAESAGGLMTVDDLATHKAEWVNTISYTYRDFTVHEIPPNGQGIAVLIALGILKHHDISQYPVDSADSIHVQIEAMKLALTDAYRYISDPASMDIELKALLSSDYLEQRARLIDLSQARSHRFGIPQRDSTVYLCTADANGMMVSYIQSNFHGFGSGIVIPGAGISMQNRGCGFSLEPEHPNRVGPRKRPYHTIIPGFATKDGKPLMGFGVMGGSMQPQGQVQIIVRMVDYGQNPQAACDAPRWRIFNDLDVGLETGIKSDVMNDLRQRGHNIRIMEFTSFGGGQLIYRLNDGYCAASDFRKDGQAVGF